MSRSGSVNAEEDSRSNRMSEFSPREGPSETALTFQNPFEENRTADSQPVTAATRRTTSDDEYALPKNELSQRRGENELSPRSTSRGSGSGSPGSGRPTATASITTDASAVNSTAKPQREAAPQTATAPPVSPDASTSNWNNEWRPTEPTAETSDNFTAGAAADTAIVPTAAARPASAHGKDDVDTLLHLPPPRWGSLALQSLTDAPGTQADITTPVKPGTAPRATAPPVSVSSSAVTSGGLAAWQSQQHSQNSSNPPAPSSWGMPNSHSNNNNNTSSNNNATPEPHYSQPLVKYDEVVKPQQREQQRSSDVSQGPTNAFATYNNNNNSNYDSYNKGGVSDYTPSCGCPPPGVASAVPAPASGAPPSQPVHPDAVVTPYIRNFVSDPQQLAQYEEVVKHRQQRNSAGPYGTGAPSPYNSNDNSNFNSANHNRNNTNNSRVFNSNNARSSDGGPQLFAQQYQPPSLPGGRTHYFNANPQNDVTITSGAPGDNIISNNYGNGGMGELPTTLYINTNTNEIVESGSRPGAVRRTRPWHYPFCNICGEPAAFCEACLCKSCQASRQCNMLTHEKPEIDPIICLVLFVLINLTASITCIDVLIIAQLRRMVRNRYGIQGNMVCDCCASFCCDPCVLQQILLEMTVMNDFPGAFLYQPRQVSGPVVEVMQ